MNDDRHLHLTRRERQIMDALYAEADLSVNRIAERLPDPPTPMAIRNMLRILDGKGLIKRRKEGREYRYSPRTQRRRAGRSAMHKVLETFFDGSLESAMGAYLADRNVKLTRQQRDALHALIEQARDRET